METKRAVIYCRVSTKEQVEEGNSLATQEKLCREYAIKNGYEIAEVFIEQGESAKTKDRTELKRLFTFCIDRKNKVNAVIAYKIDRISRNIDDYRQIRLMLKRVDIEIKSTTEFFEDSPAGKFIENMLANVAQFDNDVRTERSVNGMKDAVRDGRHIGSPPVGYSNIRIAGKSNIVPNEMAPMVKKVFEFIAKDICATEEIRVQANREGLRTKYGKPLNKSQFFKLIRSKVYAGYMTKFGETHRGIYEPLISEELFDMVQRILKKRKGTAKFYHLNNPDFPLRRFVTNQVGKRLTGAWTTGRYKKYAYYNFPGKGPIYSKDKLEKLFMNFLKKYAYDEESIERLREALENGLDGKLENKIKHRKILQQRALDLKAKRTNLIQKNYEGIINDNVLREQLSLIERDLVDTEDQLIVLPTEKTNTKELDRFTEDYLKKPDYIWSKSGIVQKYKLQWFEFPQGIVFTGKKFRTSEIRSIFKAKTYFSTPQFYGVPSKKRTSNTLQVPTSSSNPQKEEIIWEKVADDINKLAGFVEEINPSANDP